MSGNKHNKSNGNGSYVNPSQLPNTFETAYFNAVPQASQPITVVVNVPTPVQTAQKNGQAVVASKPNNQNGNQQHQNQSKKQKNYKDFNTSPAGQMAVKLQRERILEAAIAAKDAEIAKLRKENADFKALIDAPLWMQVAFGRPNSNAVWHPIQRKNFFVQSVVGIMAFMGALNIIATMIG